MYPNSQIMNFTAIDFETANYKRQSACSIGIAVVKDFQIVETFSKLIKPTPNYYEPRNISIHKITPDKTENEPSFGELWNDIKPYFENKEIVAHNASFDFSALRYVLDAHQLEYPNLEYYCSMLISRNQYQRLRNSQLPTVCDYLNIELKNHHQAESDAAACANIMIRICEDNNVESIKELANKIGFYPGQIYPNSYRPFHTPSVRTHRAQQQFEDLPEIPEEDVEHPFYQKRVVFTGQVRWSRDDAKMIVERIGGIVKPDSLSSKTNFLVVGHYDQYGEGYKSGKYKKALDLIEKGNDLEIISEMEFYEMVHVETDSFEISVEQIESDSQKFLDRNKYNDFSGKQIYFSSALSGKRTDFFQMVGYCSGYGHDYDIEEIQNTDYFVISEKIISQLKEGVKEKSILDFEEIRNSIQNRGELKSVKLLSESVFLEYIKRRKQFQDGEEEMNIYEWQIPKDNKP